MGAVLIITIVGDVWRSFTAGNSGAKRGDFVGHRSVLVMPTVSALIWKNFSHPVYRLVAFVLQKVGLHPVDWLAISTISVIIIVAWSGSPLPS
jgi:hypothetical protein